MREQIKLLFAAIMAVSLFACDRVAHNTTPLVDPWLRERTPVALVMEGQVGLPVIVNNWRNDAEGTIGVTLIANSVDISSVEVEQLVLPDGATATIEEGSKIDLSSGSATFTVTSASQEDRVYTMTYTEFYESLQGTYLMEQIDGILDSSTKDVVAVVGGYDPWVHASTPSDKNWWWSGGRNNYTYQFDDIISFRLENVDSTTGETFGTAVNYWGADGRYTRYFFADNDALDVDGYYHLVPIGQSRWKKWTQKVGDDTFTRITFYKYDTTGWETDDELFTSDWFESGSYLFTYASEEYGPLTAANPVVVPSGAFHRSWPGPWDDHSLEGDERFQVNNIRETFNMVKKVDQGPHPDHDAWLEMDLQ
jgi:hypothetical protein